MAVALPVSRSSCSSIRFVQNLIRPCLRKICRIQNPDIPRAGRVGAAQGGAAGRGGDEQEGSPTSRFAQNTTSFLFPRRATKTLLGVSLEARAKATPCKSTEEQKPRLITGLSEVYLRDDSRSSLLVADQCADAYLSLQTFFMQVISGKNPGLFPDILGMRRVCK